jgi:hypothetical protein
MAQQRVLTLAFMRPAPDDPWLNRLTGWASRHDLCHVELHFETVNCCFSILAGETAGLRAKNLSNPNYTLVSLSVPTGEYEACLAHCRRSAELHLPFDEGGMWRSYMGPACCEQHSHTQGKTFCSKIIVEALQYANTPEAMRLPPATTTPSRLYEAVYRSPRLVLNSVPFKRSAMAARGVVNNTMH